MILIDIYGKVDNVNEILQPGLIDSESAEQFDK